MAYWEEWIAKRISKTNPQILGSQNIYIIPLDLDGPMVWLYCPCFLAQSTTKLALFF